MRNGREIVAGVGIMMLLTGPIMAEDEKEQPDAFKLGEIVVTATKTERRVKDVTSAVSVVDEADIEASNADYVMDVIGSEPGIYIRKDAIYGRQFIEVRGLGSNIRRLQVLVDGRPEKMSLFGCSVAQTLPLANVERIEVVRGPESVLYGSDAMGGVVNVITKKMLDPGYQSSGLFSYGSYNTMHGLLRHGGNSHDFDYYLTYDHKQTDGHRPNSDYDADFGSLKLGYQLDDSWRLQAAGQYFRDDGEDPGPVTNPYTNNDRRKYERWSWNADLIGKWDGSEFTLTFYDNSGEHRFNMPSIEDYWHSKDNTVGLLAMYVRDVYESGDTKDSITCGYEYQHQWAEPQDDWIAWARENNPSRYMDFGPYRRNNHDLFAFNEFTMGRWVNTLGLRGSYDDSTDRITPVPQAGLLCHVTAGTTARAKIGKGFRQPRFSELHLYPAHNENLKPEEVWSYEAAISHEFAPWLSAFVNPFYMDVDNIIQQESNDSPPPNFINSNSGRFYIRGVETGLEISPARDLSVAVYYTLTDVQDGPEDNPNINRESIPEHVVSAVARYTIGRLDMSLDMEYVAGLYNSNLLAGGDIEKVGNYFTANAKASYQVHKNLKLFGGIENIFDSDYEQIPGYTMPGTTIHAGLKAEL